MKRGITKEKTQSLIEKIRDRIPEIAIRTTMLVGHPGETVQDYQELLDFIEKMRFERLGVFTYSHEEGTGSYSLKDDIPVNEKNQRAKDLMSLQEEISNEINQTKINTSMRVMIDRKESNYFIGRTEYDSPEVDNEVLIDASKDYLRIGDFSQIRIIDALPFDLIGTLAV